ncbi:oligopeptide/dipeptide ABC transporter ATP-binding protein [Mesorhizobium sp. CN2-181]|uniref:ABC transporter ATP-binding protein n=1 Tax=Mesorhizobium yinganensis TaxID=3157707 RepID=UPI0032B78563
MTRSSSETPLLTVDRLTKRYGSDVRAVDAVSFTLQRGETLGLVGESGCGKSTTGRCIIGLERLTAGTVAFEGHDVGSARRAELKLIRRNLQYVFQDPYSSLNPLMTIQATLEEPLLLAGVRRRERRDRVAELMQLVGLAPEHANRFPHEFSGGQRQRIGIARALALNPKLIILDEPVSALDVSIQAQVINLLEDLQDRLGLAYLFVAHDLSVVSHTCDRVAVMYLGRIVEIGTRDEIFDHPTHPYTQALLSAIPIHDPDKRGQRRRIVLSGDLPNAANPPSGCRFRTRCWKASEICAATEPILEPKASGQQAACHFAPSKAD